MKDKQALALGQRLKALRINQKMNQRDFAKLLDIPQSYISKLESGIRIIPTRLLLKITNVFDVELNYFDLNKPEPTSEDCDIPMAIAKKFAELQEEIRGEIKQLEKKIIYHEELIKKSL